MGYFSWLTADTKDSVANNDSVHPNAHRTPYLLQPNGEPAIGGEEYEGYGVFDGIDAYEWLARMNQAGKDRDAGIDLEYSGEPIKYPIKISYDANAIYEELPASEPCPYQGFDYEFEDEL